MRFLFTSPGDEERGATATEYALLIALIAAVIVVGVGAFGIEVQNLFDRSCSTIVATFGQTC